MSVAYKPKVGRPPWQEARHSDKDSVATATTTHTLESNKKNEEDEGTPSRKEGSAGNETLRRSSGEWDSKFAISLIFLIIAVNVALVMLLSSDAPPSAQTVKEGEVTVRAKQAPASDEMSAAVSGSRDELLSIISRH